MSANGMAAILKFSHMVDTLELQTLAVVQNIIVSLLSMPGTASNTISRTSISFKALECIENTPFLVKIPFIYIYVLEIIPRSTRNHHQ